MQVTTLQNGTYTYSSPLSGAAVVAQVEGGKLVSLTQAGEAQPVTALAAAQVEHLVSYLDDVAFTPTPQKIGKARAATLHRLMARAGIPSGQHYGFASDALGEPVYSLAALSEQQARVVWRWLQATTPNAA